MAVDCLKPGPRKPWKQYVDVELTEGWAQERNSFLYHYYKDKQSLCGRGEISALADLQAFASQVLEWNCERCADRRREIVEAEQIAAMNRRF